MTTSRLSRFVSEIRRRQLPGVLALYVVVAWVVIQVCATLFPGWQIADEAIRYVWYAALSLFPLALVFGWFYDVSTRGLRRTLPGSSIDQSRSLQQKDFMLLGTLAFAAAAIGGVSAAQILSLKSVPAFAFARQDIPEQSIAVLPFVNMSDDASNEYFSDGISEQLLNELARIPDLHVAARTSSFHYKDKTEPMPVIGQQLGVRTILEGSVRKAGSRLRVTAQLINASDGYHLWSETYDREFDDVFALQDEISRAIVSTLKVKLLASDEARLDRPPTSNAAAYDLYLQANAARMEFTDNGLLRSSDYLQRAIDLDPEFALAYDALGYGYLLESFYGMRTVDNATEAAEGLLYKALELQPDLEQAHASLGLMKSNLQRFQEANTHFEKALEINPDYMGALINHGFSLVRQGRLKEASARYLRAQSMDPMNASLSFNLGALMMLLGQYDSGYEFMQRALEIEPNMGSVKAALTHWMAQYGRVAEAIKFGGSVFEAEPELTANVRSLVNAYLLLGMKEQAERVFATGAAANPDDASIDGIRLDMWASTGNTDAFNDDAEREFAALDTAPGNPLNYADLQVVRRFALAELNRGRYEEAAELYLWAIGGEEGIEATTYDFMAYLKQLALAYRGMGLFDDAEALLQRSLDLVAGARDNGWSTPVLFVRLAEIHAALGDMESAVENLDIAYERGWRNLATLNYGLFWQEHRNDPALDPLRLKIEADIADQRQRISM